jgi:ubiquinone/menaquinone biosynthesis C-methylase UbiE
LWPSKTGSMRPEVSRRQNGPVPLADKATRARSFGAVAEVYDRGRPGWPAEAVEWALGPEPLEVLDLGAGTGKLTLALLAAGHRVTALEPLAEMRAILAERLAADASVESARAAVVDGRAEEIPFPDDSFDAVVAGSAFHWFDREPTLAEVVRVLRPPGAFGLFGNRYDTSVDWQRRLRAVTSGGVAYRGGHWPRQPELRRRFAEVKDRAIAHRMEVDPALLRDYLGSLSAVSTMEPAERAVRLAAIDEFWASEPELRERDSATLLWRTDVRRCRGLLD